MKKIAKISLVAAIAVAGFTTANAQPLEEAIKNVDVTGSVVYRYNNYANDAKAGTLFDSKNNDISKKSSNTNEYKAALGLASKVNDDVKFNSRFVVGKPSVVAGAAGTQDNGFATLDSSDNADQNVDVSLTQAYFGYTGVKNTTVNVGKQGLTTPWTVAVDSDGNEQTGTGILALSTVGPVTLAGAYFNQTNLSTSSDAALGGYDFNSKGNVTSATKLTAAGIIDGSEDIMTVGAIATLAPVTADAWYLTMTDRFDTYTVGAKATTKLANIDLSADARYASLTLDKKIDPEEQKNTLAKLVVSGDAGLVDAKLAYAKTGKEGGLTALDNDANTTLLGWSLTSNGKTDADYVQAVLGFDILSNLNLSANYGNLQYITEENSTEDIEEEEVYAQLTYKMSKNLTTYVRYGEYSKEVSDVGYTEKLNDDTRGRLQVEYTF